MRSRGVDLADDGCECVGDVGGDAPTGKTGASHSAPPGAASGADASGPRRRDDDEPLGGGAGPAASAAAGAAAASSCPSESSRSIDGRSAREMSLERRLPFLLVDGSSTFERWSAAGAASPPSAAAGVAAAAGAARAAGAAASASAAATAPTLGWTTIFFFFFFLPPSLLPKFWVPAPKRDGPSLQDPKTRQSACLAMVA